MTCRNCGCELKEHAKFCANCGTRVEPIPAPAAPVYEVPAPEEIIPTPVIPDVDKTTAVRRKMPVPTQEPEFVEETPVVPQERPRKSGKGKIWIIIGAVLVLIALLVAATFLMNGLRTINDQTYYINFWTKQTGWQEIDGNTYYFIQLADSRVFYSISASSNRDVVTLNVGDMVTIEHEIPAEGTSPSILDGYSLTIYPVIGSVDGPTAELGFTVDGEEVPTIEEGAEVPFQFQTFPGHIAVVS